MRNAVLEDVFGVGRGHVLSYIERDEVDGAFLNALRSDRQIVVYGASKQGKTSLVNKYLPYDDNITVSCSPASQAADIYKSILRQVGVDIATGSQEVTGTSAEAGVSTKFQLRIPLLGATEAAVSGKGASSREKRMEFECVEYNLSIPQDVFELFCTRNARKLVILENFHYLDDATQRQLAFDLRTFQELGLRIIILGVWRERNRLVQFNGDLQDRIAEIPVEPWDRVEFINVANKGARELNISFSGEILEAVCRESFGSIGVVQELLKTLCLESGVRRTQALRTEIHDARLLHNAIRKKAEDYASRHIRALEDIAKGQRSSRARNDLEPLHLPYYFVRAIVGCDFPRLLTGIERRELEDRIRREHHRGADVRPSDISNLLNSLVKMQAAKHIEPPLFDYDRAQRKVTVMDSTFYFFIKHCDTAELLEELYNPLEA